jgi:DnaJ-class molecular chaperone
MSDTDRKNPGDEDTSGTKQTGENTCPTCSGSGRVGEKPCPDCGGSGRITAIVGDA